jgi:hypothetical protein
MGEVLSEQQRAFLEATHGAVADQRLLGRVADRRRPGGGPPRARVEDNLRLYRVATGHDPDDLAEYRAAMVSERRLVHVLTPEWVYPSSR